MLDFLVQLDRVGGNISLIEFLLKSLPNWHDKSRLQNIPSVNKITHPVVLSWSPSAFTPDRASTFELLISNGLLYCESNLKFNFISGLNFSC